jgi:carbon-monoxide dehydrogenase iron sulfur subunit
LHLWEGWWKVKKIYAKEDVCIGCRLCEVWCKVEHSERKDIIKTFKKEQKKHVARVSVETDGPNSFALQCRHCDEPYCAYGCITGAMRKNPETGEVILDRSKCVGCWTCILMCPNGAIKMDVREEDNHPVSLKCDLCGGREIPSCVEHCPNDALIFVEESEMVEVADDEAEEEVA